METEEEKERRRERVLGGGGATESAVTSAQPGSHESKETQHGERDYREEYSTDTRSQCGREQGQNTWDITEEVWGGETTKHLTALTSSVPETVQILRGRQKQVCECLQAYRAVL